MKNNPKNFDDEDQNEINKFDIQDMIESILKEKGVEPPEKSIFLGDIINNFGNEIYVDMVRNSPKDIPPKFIKHHCLYTQNMFLGMAFMKLGLVYPTLATKLFEDLSIDLKSVIQDSLSDLMTNKYLNQELNKVQGQFSISYPDCDICEGSVDIKSGEVWVLRSEIIAAENELPIPDNNLIKLSEYKLPPYVHIYWGHLKCQPGGIFNSYSAEILETKTKFIEFSAHIFSKRWFKYSDYSTFARNFSKNFKK